MSFVHWAAGHFRNSFRSGDKTLDLFDNNSYIAVIFGLVILVSADVVCLA